MEIAAILVGAILAWLSTWYFQYRKDRADQRRLLTVIFGELLNIRRHYAYSSNELPRTIESQADTLTVEMCVYGDLSFTKNDLSRLGFLRDQDIADLIQLSLKIRNTDLALQHTLKHFREKTDSVVDLSYSRDRMAYVSSVVDRIIAAIVARNPNLQNIVPDIDQLDHTL